MNIQYFKENVIDVYRNDFSIKPSFEFQSGYFGNRKYATVYALDISDDTLILKAKEDAALDKIYKFEDFSIFNSVNNVVFKLNDTLIKNFKLIDIAWSDGIFVFEADLNKYGL